MARGKVGKIPNTRQKLPVGAGKPKGQRPKKGGERKVCNFPSNGRKWVAVKNKENYTQY